MLKLVNTRHLSTFEKYFSRHFQRKTPDCFLYSEDGSHFKIHKELLTQTNFLREILSSTKEHYFQEIEIFCPCSKEELQHLVKFLYEGEICCPEQFDSLKIQESLHKIFGTRVTHS